MIFLSECDSSIIGEEYKILNYKKYIHDKINEDDKTILVALLRSDLAANVVQRHDLQVKYPIIYLELSQHANGSIIILCGIYRQWGNKHMKN